MLEAGIEVGTEAVLEVGIEVVLEVGIEAALEVGVFGGGVEGGACFGGVVTVAVDGDGWVFGAEVAEEGEKRFALCWGACVLGGSVVGGESSDVADSDGVCVVASAVGSGLGDGTACVDGSVEVDDVVIADVGPSLGEVPLAYVLGGEVLAFRGC